MRLTPVQMQSVHEAEDQREVYMIFRVHNLEDENIAMRVYLDPEQLRQEDRLAFTGETWSVVPKAPMSTLDSDFHRMNLGVGNG